MYYKNIRCEYIAPWIQIFEEGQMTNPGWKIFWIFWFGFVYIHCPIPYYKILHCTMMKNFFELFDLVLYIHVSIFSNILIYTIIYYNEKLIVFSILKSIIKKLKHLHLVLCYIHIIFFYIVYFSLCFYVLYFSI